MGWVSRGKWLPVLEAPDDVTADRLVVELHARVHRTGNTQAAEQTRQKQSAYEKRRKDVRTAQQQVKQRKLRGPERDAVIQAEVEPLRQEMEVARAEWLQALEASVPAPYLALGKTLSVTPQEYRRQLTERLGKRLYAAFASSGSGASSFPPASLREDADFAVALACEACTLRNGRVIPTEFQLITGSGHQFFLETLGALMEQVTPEQIRRALFGPWQYADPRLSFRWDPVEDRRYAYSWSDPSGNEVRTEHGANMLAAMGLPLLPAVPTASGLVTTGFDSRQDPPTFTWPIWESMLGRDVVRSLLALEELREPVPDRVCLQRRGIVEVFRSSKIEVGRPPLSKFNLTPAVSV
jgi:hypothetical protein